jgi:hypothetical protein
MQKQDLQGGDTSRSEHMETRSVASEDTENNYGIWSGKAAKLHLRSSDPETRLLWVTMLLKAKELTTGVASQ